MNFIVLEKNILRYASIDYTNITDRLNSYPSSWEHQQFREEFQNISQKSSHTVPCERGSCVWGAQNVWDVSWNQQVEPCLASCNRSEMFHWTKLTTKQQQCINIPLRASASAGVTGSSWPPPPFMKITWCWRQSGGKPVEARNRRNWILWEGLLYLSLKFSICGSKYVYE